MSFGNEYLLGSQYANGGAASFVRVRLRTFQVPPVRDAAVIGRLAPISRKVMEKTLRLMSPEPFVAIDLRDDTIASILARQAILRKIGPEAVKNLVLRSIKPFMAKTEIVALSLAIEVELGERL